MVATTVASYIGSDDESKRIAEQDDWKESDSTSKIYIIIMLHCMRAVGMKVIASTMMYS